MKKRTHDRMFTFSPRHVWRGGFLLLALVLTTALIAYAGASNPGFLNENTSDISAGNHSYRVWYTTSCDDGSSSDCECDSALDKDTDGDGVDDTDSPNDCIATSDSDGDGIFDTGADSDGDGVLNLMDLGWTNSGTGVVESTPLNVQRSVNRYVNDWGLKDPKWDRDENRNIYVYDIGVNGRAFGDGSGELYDTRLQMLTNMDSRATVLHELWHNEQYAYSAGGGAWLMEGQAAFLEDKVFQDLDRYAPSWHHGLVDGYLGNPVKVKREDRDDDGKKEFAQTIGLTGRSYQATLWWTYVAEQAGTQYLGTTWEGVDALEAVLEQSDDHGRKGKDAVDRVLRDRLGQGFDDTFWDFTVANYAKEFDLTELDHGYLHGRDPEEVLQYRDEVLTGTSPVNYDPVGRTTIGGTDLTGGKSGGVNAKSSEISSTASMPAYGARYYEADLTSVSECPLVYWQVDGHEESARFMHSWIAVQADSNGDGDEEVVSISRIRGDEFNRALWNGYQSEPGQPDYTRALGIVATGDRPRGYDWEMGCAFPTITIVEPTTGDPAFVGTPAEPGRFLLWVEVQDTSGAIDYVEGLDWRRDFTVTVGADSADVLNGGYVQNQYWLVVDAPQKPGASVGDEFDVTVELGPDRTPATETKAVVYDTRTSDQVLVIDQSGSMNGDPYPTKLDSAKSAARLFADVKQKDDWIGVVSFSADATKQYDLTHIPDSDDSAGIRAAARSKIDAISPYTTTSIGDGLDMGQQMLSATHNVDHHWAMVLLSDGKENEPKYWWEVRPDVVGAGTKVHAIALGADADEELMRRIAEATCGARWVDRCYNYVPTSTVGTAGAMSAAAASSLPNRLADTYRRIEKNIAGQQRLWEDSGALAGSETIEVPIEEAGARDAFFSFHWDDPDASPTINVSGGGVSFIKLEDGKTHVVLFADTLPDDVYRIQMSSSRAINWVGSLSGRLVSGTEMHAFLDNAGYLERMPGLPARIEASLTDDGGPVSGAAMTATVRRPDGEVETVQLVDDGGPYDDEAGDGVYSYVYDRINRPLEMPPQAEHSWIFDLYASGTNNSGVPFERHDRLTYTPIGSQELPPDYDDDGMIDRWEDRFDAADSMDPGDAGKDPDEDGLTNKEEFELGTTPDEPDTDAGGELDGSELSGGQNPLLTADDRLPPLGEFWVEGYTGHTYTDTVISKTVILHFTPRPEYQNVRLYRASGSAAGFAKVGDFDPSVGKIVDRGLVNDREYFYYLQPVGASGVMGRPSLVRRAEPAIDPVPPKATVIINDGDQFAHSRTVSVTVQGSDDIAYMQVSNSPDLDGAPLQAYQDEFSWTLDPDPDTGVAFVYVQLQDDSGNESEVFGAGIVYKPPIVLPGGLLDLGRVLADFRPFPDYTIYYELLNFTGLGLGGGASGMGQLNAAQGNEPLYHAGLSFDLEARDAMSQPVTEFEELYTLTVSYEDWQWRSAGIGSEGSLNLYWNADQGWEPVLPCEGCSHDVEENVIVARLDHLTEFVLMGEPPVPIYLPLILKGF